MAESLPGKGESRLLNPALYRGLVRLYGHPQRVHVLRPGQPNRWREEWSTLPSGDVRLRKLPVERGEEYSVDCFLCGDRRRRLLINHCFGVPDEVDGDRRLWMVNCFHRQCFSSLERRLYLYDLLYVYEVPQLTDPDREPVSAPGTDVLAPVTTLPAEVISLEELPRRTPLGELHPAWTYLQDRGFSPQRLSRWYGVGFCLRSEAWPRLANRLFIPIYQAGLLYGFQGRYPGEPGRHSPHQPKYWNMPGLRKERLVYGLDTARHFPVVLVCEGVFDVWSAGPCAVALLGKTMSTAQLEVLCRSMPERFGVIAALDPDQPEVEQQRQKPHHLQELYLMLRGALGPDRVRVVWLPSGTDCGSLPTEFIWARILEQVGGTDELWGAALRDIAGYCCRQNCRLGACPG